MAALFPDSADDIARGVTLAGVVGAAATLALLLVLARAPQCTREEAQPAQPVLFDHRHHVRDDGIDCLYCHDRATHTRVAGVPPTSRCLGCHAQIWATSPALALVRKNEPIHWQRVAVLPDFVFFDHHAHVDRGVGCATCHGRVDRMPRVYNVASLTMGFCLDCHRDPAPHLRPLDRITDMEWQDDPVVGARIASELHIHAPTDCTGCHR